jgi:hypothetical protein
VLGPAGAAQFARASAVTTELRVKSNDFMMRFGVGITVAHFRWCPSYFSVFPQYGTCETTARPPNPVQLRNSNRKWTQMNTDKIKNLSSSAFICG